MRVSVALGCGFSGDDFSGNEGSRGNRGDRKGGDGSEGNRDGFGGSVGVGRGACGCGGIGVSTRPSECSGGSVGGGDALSEGERGCG